MEGSGSMEFRDQGKGKLHRLMLADSDMGLPTTDPGFRAVAAAYCANVNSLANWSLYPGRIKSWLWVKDDDAELNVAEDISVGSKDSAFVLVADAGWIDCGSLYIGKDDSSTRTGTSGSVWVHGDNSSMNMAGHLFVSASSDAGDFAGMLISDQGEVSCHHAYIGKVVGHDTVVGNNIETRWEPWPGYLRVDGLAAELHALDALHVGNQGQAQVDIFNGGRIQADTSVEITGLSTTNGGSVYIGTGSVMQAPQVNVRQFGHLLGTGRVIGNVHNLGGHVAPGFSPGTLTIHGDYVQDPNGILDIEVGPDTHDILNLTGNVDLHGTIRLTFVRGFAPVAGHTISFIETPASVNLPAVQFQIRNLKDGFQYETQVSDGQVKLLPLNDAVYDPTPDMDNDGTVNLADFAILLEQWSMHDCRTCYGADLTEDNAVTFADLAILAQRWLKGPD